MIRSLFTTRFLRIAGATLALAATVPSVLFAQSGDAPKKEYSDRVAESLAKIQELIEAKQWNEILQMIAEELAAAEPNSYDSMVLKQIKLQILLTLERYSEAITPLEDVLRMGTAYDFLDQRRFLEFNQILSQLYFQEATDITGTSPAELRRKEDLLNKAYQTIKVYLAENENPTEDSLSYAATMIYTQATLDEGQTDTAMLNEARIIAEQGILMSLTPRESFYVLILAALQQDGKNVEAAEILETLVRLKPTNKQYWQQLQATYLNLANDAEEGSRESIEWNIRTVLTIDRAQRLGILDEPRDHFNRVGILMNIQQFDQAINHLVEGLKIGKIEDTLQNWEYLASSYQQVNKELAAIDALQTAASKFPDQGEIDFRIANIYYIEDELEKAYESGKTALEKGQLKNRPAVLMFVAYMAYELKEYEEALPLATEAKDTGAERAEGLLDAVTTAIEARQAALEATI
jgi:hypothetical protein